MSNDFRIPKKFQLFGNTINVEWVAGLSTNDMAWGRANYGTNTIELQAGFGDYVRDEHSTKQTFMHELIHHILYHSGHGELASNEQFVEIISQLFYQFFVSAQYDSTYDNIAKNGLPVQMVSTDPNVELAGTTEEDTMNRLVEMYKKLPPDMVDKFLDLLEEIEN